MTYEMGLHPGTTWHKCDFQCHTPRDRDWTGSADLPGGNEAAELARRQWAGRFIAAAEAAKLQAALAPNLPQKVSADMTLLRK